tara:strand:+ start:460 stop:963 length:504 start_codon:yes stop_codon:yes gene_type:complete
MQLRNTPIPPKAMPAARLTLPQSDAAHGLQAMTPPNAGMYNSDDSGAFSKPYINAQPTENQALALQDAIQNQQTAAPQAVAAARGAVSKDITEGATMDYRTQEYLNTQVINQMDAMGLGGNMMKLNALMQNVGEEKVRNQVLTQQAMAMNQAPELGAYVAQMNQYRA